MSLRLIKAVAETENLDDFHLGRLLVLLGSADARRSTAITKAKAVEGITKLAKLDFLLRYPTCLERALGELGKDPTEAAVHPRERTSIEAKMVRFRYGPWDARYRRWLGLLVARGLVTLGVAGANRADRPHRRWSRSRWSVPRGSVLCRTCAAGRRRRQRGRSNVSSPP
jgi:hypothetical protein